MPKITPMRELAVGHVRYLAGLLEGEGCFYTQNYNKAGRHYVRVSLAMTDEDVVRGVHNLVASGSVYCDHRSSRTSGKHSDYWRWTLNGTEAEKLMRLILPYMGQRRSR